jgi:Domain of unknown function (DUF4252)
MKRLVLSIAAVLAFCACGFAQDIKIPVNIEKLSKKASEVVDVNLDGAMLKFASKFLSDEEQDDVEAQQLIKNLKGIYVRSFEFDNPGEFSEADVEEVRAQLKAPTWVRTVNVRSKKDSEKVDVFFKMEGDNVMGLAIIASEPKELTIVNLVGLIDPSKLSQLSGHFGIPKIEPAPKPAPKPTTAPTPKAAPKAAAQPAPKAVVK